MIIHPEFVYVANPRTASRSTETLLMEVLGREAVQTERHHPMTSHPALRRDVPIIGTVRDPLDWIVSWYHHCKRPVEFPEFVTSFKNGWLFDDRLAVYAGYMTQAFVLEDWGVTGIVKAIVGEERFNEWADGVGFATDLVPHIGKTGPESELWETGLTARAQQRFPADFMLYQSAKQYRRPRSRAD